MGRLKVICGIAGSGKSTIADQYRKLGYEVFSSNAIRGELWGDENEQKNPGAVFDLLHTRIAAALREGYDCVYDATNLNARRREGFLNFLENSNVDYQYAECIVVLCPYELALKRQTYRKRRVSGYVIESQIRQFQVPSFSEGWDAITLVCGGRYNYNIFEKFGNTPHDNPNHSLSIEEHMRTSLREASKMTSEQWILDAAAFHDIGKLYSKSFLDRDGNKTKEAHYYNHEYIGAYLYLLYMTSYEATYGLPIDLKKNARLLDTAFLIQHHMRHYVCDESSMKRFYKKIGTKMMKALKIVEQADEAAH